MQGAFDSNVGNSVLLQFTLGGLTDEMKTTVVCALARGALLAGVHVNMHVIRTHVVLVSGTCVIIPTFFVLQL